MRAIGGYFDRVASSTIVAGLARALGEGKRCAATGAHGSSTSLVCGAITRQTDRVVVQVVAHVDDADEAVADLRSVGVHAVRLPALETIPGETGVSRELLAERLGVLRRLAKGELFDGAGVFVCPIQALMQSSPGVRELESSMVDVVSGGDLDGGQEGFIAWLAGHGFDRTDSVREPGEFAVRGGIVDVFAPGCLLKRAGRDEALSGAAAVRVDFFGDEVDSVHEIDLDTMGSDARVDRVSLVRVDESGTGGGMNALELLGDDAIGVLCETTEVVEQARGYFERVTDSGGVYGPPAVLKLLEGRMHGVAEVNQFSVGRASSDAGFELPVSGLPEFSRDAAGAVREAGEATGDHEVVLLCANDGEAQRMGELRGEFAADAPGELTIDVGYLHRGFVWGDESAGGGALMVVPSAELLHRYATRRRSSVTARLGGGKTSETFYEIQSGDYVVHADHGVARFLGLKTMRARQPKERAAERAARVLRGEEEERKAPEEYLVLEFAKRSKLNVPVSQVEKVQKYVGGFRGKPTLSAIGGKRWSNQKTQVKEAVKDLAGELLRVQAAREHSPGVRYPADTAWQTEFEAEFPYEETEDQLTSLAQIKRDMATPRPMDRLLCGDVGYGKTELAIRAAFKAVEFGKQVAILVPTTLLAEQHERTFCERFADYPFTVESLSRFKTRKEQNDVLMRVRLGQVDILIGTHRILSKDVRFSDLGLVVVDEEQRFGVEHKNALLKLRTTADVLTLSATPIPRTLHMAMLGLRDISSLTTAPLERRAVVTEVIPYNEKRIKAAIARELNRDGQVFFVHNRVHNIQTVADDIQKLAPEAKILVGHGQMPDGELEKVMREFVARRADILVATTIIESGIDIPTANTMFINSADMFGLAELHQLRGRVGRYKHRAYCYLLLPNDRTVNEVAVKRLRAIEEFSMLGAGFKIAMRDLEIRGAGNLLGAEQSGHIAAVGYDMYCRLLEESAKELRHETTAQVFETSVEIGLSGRVPEAYIPSDARRIEAYRRIAMAEDEGALEKVRTDIEQAYGELPRATRELFENAGVRVAAAALGVRSVALHEQDVILRCDEPALVVERMREAKGTVRVVDGAKGSDVAEVFYRPPASYLTDANSLALVLRRRLGGIGVGVGVGG